MVRLSTSIARDRVDIFCNSCSFDACLCAMCMCVCACVPPGASMVPRSANIASDRLDISGRASASFCNS